jgi:hypothetical protein
MEHTDMKKQSRIEFKLDGNSWVTACGLRGLELSIFDFEQFLSISFRSELIPSAT